jgi:hypothetical protein
VLVVGCARPKAILLKLALHRPLSRWRLAVLAASSRFREGILMDDIVTGVSIRSSTIRGHLFPKHHRPRPVLIEGGASVISVSLGSPREPAVLQDLPWLGLDLLLLASLCEWAHPPADECSVVRAIITLQLFSSNLDKSKYI